MDFNIGEDIEESSEFESNNKEKNPMIFIAIIAVVVGIIVFLIMNVFFGKKEIPAEPPKETKLSLTEENVQILYSYVTYGIRNKRNDKFLTENVVTLDSFSNQEKFYYALQFAQVEDFEATGKLNPANKKIYTLNDAQIKNYMQRFFGGKVTYNYTDSFAYPFSFSINGQNVGNFTPPERSTGMEVVFDGFQPDLEESIVEPFYAELVEAYKESDGTYRLVEKAIYTKVEDKGNGYFDVSIYRDAAHTLLIETKQNQNNATMLANPISASTYRDKASTITYHFGLYNSMLYFDRSEISLTNNVKQSSNNQ